MRISDWSSDVCSSDLAATLYGLLAAQESFGQYRLLAHQTKSAAAVEADLLAARLAVQDFIRVGTDDAAEAVRKRVESADTHLDPAVFQDPAKRARAEQADIGIGKYGEAFDLLVPLRDRRDELVADPVRVGAEAERLEI